MKKLLGIAALILAFAPLAQAQNEGEGLPGHPDARNDRKAESYDAKATGSNHKAKKTKSKAHHKAVKAKAKPDQAEANPDAPETVPETAPK